MNYKRAQISPEKLSTYIKIGIYSLCVGIFFFLWISWTGDIPVNVEQKIHITSKTTLSNLHDTLHVNISDIRYKLWRILFAPDIQLQAGIFVVPEETNTLKKIFVMLQNPSPSEEEITILPGWHKGEIRDALKNNVLEGDLLVDESKLIDQFEEKYIFLQGKTSLEGFLMPDTYRFIGGSNISVLIERMLDNFNKKIYQPYKESGRPDELFYDVLILASIVGEEEKSVSQIQIVADILKKRLRKGWHIGADITLCYAELIPGTECQKYVNNYYSSNIHERTEKNNLYDTRNNIGLPPTPIASVTSDTFLVTMNSEANTEAWYYLHDNSGTIRTATTNAEHEENKRLYLK